MKIVLKFGEFFCGPGGLAFGAINSSGVYNRNKYIIKHSWANDIDEFACETYRKNIAPDALGSVLCGDVRTLDVSILQPVDIFAFGFPCNDFSIVGEQKGMGGNYGPLYTYGVNILNLMKPKFFVAENVSGITSANDGEAFKKILFDLKNAGNGYNLTVNLYKAEEYGVPQNRHRVVIVGVDEILGLKFKVPKQTTKRNPMTVKEALEGIPIPLNAYNNELTRQASIVVERLKYIKPGENVWNADLPKHLKLNVTGATMSQIYKKLHPDKPSYTITGSGGGGTHGYHYYENRALTNRERARIQTFPDNFIFVGSKEKVRKQIGMAVPPKLSKVIFTALLKTYAGQIYDCIPENLPVEVLLNTDRIQKNLEEVADKGLINRRHLSIKL